MKVLFVSNLFPDSSDPVRGRINATLLHRLSRKVSIRAVGLRPILPFLNKNRARLQPVPEDEIFQPVYRGVVYVPKVGGPVNHRLLSADILRTLHRIRREFAYDVVLGSWIYPDVCGIERALRRFRKTRVPLVGIAQGSDVHQYLGLRFRRKLIVGTLNRIAATITRSKDLAQRLREAGVASEKLHPIYNGVDTDLFRRVDRDARRAELGWSKDQPVFLYVGNLLPIKNPLLLVRAHARLVAEQSDKGNPPRLVIVGSGPLERKIREEAGAAGTGGLVELVGRKPSGEIARYMQAADLLCIPSDNEGVPNVALEAMACGLPVVATEVGGIPEVIDRPYLGNLVSRGDEGELVQAFESHLIRPRLRDQIAAHAVQYYSWDATVDAYLKVLIDAHVGRGASRP